MKLGSSYKNYPVLRICSVFAALIVAVFQIAYYITDPITKRVASVIALGLFIYGVVLLVLQLIKNRK